MSAKQSVSPSSSEPSKRPKPDQTVVPNPSSSSTTISKSKKRSHGEANHKHGISDLFPLQEIFLRILSFLSPLELASVQSVNKYWSKMSLDPQLWKRLYLSRYSHPHHSRLIHTDALPLSTTPRSLRPIARLPSRAFPPPSPSRSPSLSVTSATARSVLPLPNERPSDRIGHARNMTRGQARDETAEDVGYGIRNDGVDWKVMLRLGSNWSNGNAVSQTTVPLPSSSNLPRTNSDRTTSHSSTPSYTEHHIALFPSFIFTSHPDSPLVHVHQSSNPIDNESSNAKQNTTAPIGIIPPPPGWSSPSRPDNVTAICADQAVALAEDIDVSASGSPHRSFPARLAIFYQSGGFAILRVRYHTTAEQTLSTSSSDRLRISWVRESVHPPRSRPRSLRHRTAFEVTDDDPVVLAAMHYPVLITCTLAFHLSVYSLLPPLPSGEPSKPRHLQTLHSDVSFHPAALSLFPFDANTSTDKHLSAPLEASNFKAALTYCTPLYPSSWTVAVQELGINLTLSPSEGISNTESVWRGDCWNVGRGDEAEDTRSLWPRKLTPIVGVRGERAVGVGMDGRWCVLAGADNQIQVYSLPTPSPSPPPLTREAVRSPNEATKIPPIIHSQTLLAHSAAVTSISLSAGRCVSSGRDGRILVWELDEEYVTPENGYQSNDSGDRGQARVGRTVGFVEVRQGGRREKWRGATGPARSEDDDNREGGTGLINGLPHPQSISSAARTLFLPRPPTLLKSGQSTATASQSPPAIRQLTFDEEKIVGLVRGTGLSGDLNADARSGDTVREVMKVWSFN